MNEWLTTGQMIDKLKDGETAESKCGKKAIFNHGAIEFHDKTSNIYAYFHNGIIDAKWHILPKYVSFEEAMKAFKEGKKIWVEHNDEKDWFSNVLHFGKREASPSFGEMIYGKWTIEEES